MIGRAAYGVFWVALIALGLAGAYFAVFYTPQPPSLDSGAQRLDDSRRAPIAGGSRERTAVNLGPERRVRRGGDDVVEVPEPGRRAQDLRRLGRERARTESVARSFFSAFASYELGELDRPIVARLRATATAGFADELIRVLPRMPVGPPVPTLARLGRLDFLAGDLGADGALRGAELVGWVERDDRRSPIAIEFVKAHQAWLVSGIGR